MAMASYDKARIGSQCFSIEGTSAGVRVLIGGTLSGHAASGGLQVLIATFPRAFGMPGAPVVDEYGDLLGIVGAGLPGDSRPVDDIVEARGPLNGAPVIPLAGAVAQAVAPGSELAALRVSGELMPSLAVSNQISAGGFTRTPLKRGDFMPDFVKALSAREPAVGVFLMWSPTERVRGAAVLRVFDSENKVVATSEPRKVSLNKGGFARLSWEMPMPKVSGVYRADLTVDTRTYWRGFVRINP